jgi:hypothetical protein
VKKQGIRTGLIGLVLVVLATGVAFAATSGGGSATVGAQGSVSDQYGNASVQAGVQAQVGPVVVQGATAAGYGGRGWRGGTLKHCVVVRKKGSKHAKRTCLRQRKRFRLAHKLRQQSTKALSHSALCTLPHGCAAAAPIGVGGRSAQPIQLPAHPAAQALAVSSARVAGGPFVLIAVACAALAALALVATARRTLRRVRASRD